MGSTGGAMALCKELKIDYLGSLPIDQLLLQCCENGQCFLKYSAKKEGAAMGTRVALINIIKQITSRINEQYAKDIEKREMYFKQREYKIEDSDDSEIEQDEM